MRIRLVKMTSTLGCSIHAYPTGRKVQADYRLIGTGESTADRVRAASL